ncbi:DUF3883 domain-containing protein [Photobacterium sp. DNB23_23_1]
MRTVQLDGSGKIRSLKTLAKDLSPADIESSIATFNELNQQVPTYNESTGYDLIVDGERYPPKAIFGLAMSRLLDYDVMSNHFSGGLDSPCFKVLQELGYDITTKPRPNASNGLHLYNTYTREQLSDIFDPGLKFTTGSGRWGGTGIVANTPRKNDFSFIVTLEDKSKYDDYLTEDGVLFWKSQDGQTPNHNQIKSLFTHDEMVNTIYLFMRVKRTDPYTFFGTLAFKDWDPTTSEPVHFQWTMLSWPLPKHIHANFSKHIKPALNPNYVPIITESTKLTEVPPPKPKLQSKSKSRAKRPPSGSIDWAKREQRNRELGQAGELFVIEYEKQKLIAANLCNLAEQVEHVAQIDSSAGYDIKSFNLDGNEIYIEVKTTTGSISNPFYISRNEVDVSNELDTNFWVYRLFDFKFNNKKNKFFALRGSICSNFELTPETFKATVK